MALQIIDVGNVANDGTGDPLRTAFQIVNDNFIEVASPSSMANGSSRIDIAQDGNISMTSNGIANVMVVSSTQVTVNGDLAVTGNAILTGNILGDRIQNGTTIIDIQSPGGNANIIVGNVSVAAFAPTGEYINGLLSVGGNVTANNLLALTTVSTVGNIIGGNLVTGGLISAVGNIDGNQFNANTITVSTVSVTSDIIGGNFTTNGVISTTSDVVANNVSAAGSFTAAEYSATGNIIGGNLLTGGNVSATGNATFADLTIGSGNTGNAIIYGNLTVYGNTTTIFSNNVTTNDLTITVGNNQTSGAALNGAGIDVGSNDLATWHFNNATTSWQTNLDITPASNIALNLGGTTNYWATAYVNSAVVSSTVSAVGNVIGGNLLTTGLISATGNITVGNIVATNIGNIAQLNFDGNGSNVLLGNGVFGNTTATLGALNYVQNSVANSVVVTTADSFPYTIVSTFIATNGNPVQIFVTGDANPLAAGNGQIQFYRDSTAIGQPITYEASAANENSPYALQFVDTPSYGSYTYSLKAVGLTANTQFGETNGPVLTTIELQNVKGDAGAPYAWRVISANGTSITANVSEATLTYTPGNNIVITGNTTANVVTFAVSNSPSFIGNVTGGNILTTGIVSATGNITGSNINANLFATSASVSGNATLGNANIGGYTTNALQVNGTGYIVASPTTDPYPNTGTLDIAAVTEPNVVIRGYSQSTSNTSGPVLQFVRKQQTGFALTAGYDAGRMKFWAIQPNNNTYNYVGEVAGITAGSGTDGQLELYSGLANVPQLVLTLNSSKQANFTGAVSAVGNITGNYFFGNGSQLTGVAATTATALTNGTTNLTTGLNGNANLTIGGTSNVVVWATTGEYVTGLVSVTGNITGGNIAATNHTGTNVSVTGTVTAASTVGGVITGTSVSVTANVTSGNVTTGIASVTSITKTGSNAVGNIGSASNYFNQIFATATTALYADLAENYLADQLYPVGTVLSFGGSSEITQSFADGDNKVIGIVSEKPAYIMNSGLQGEFVTAIALQGRVPCLVQGPVRRGDMMVSAGNGRARAEANPQIGTVLGKALQDFDGEQGIIEVVIGKT